MRRGVRARETAGAGRRYRPHFHRRRASFDRTRSCEQPVAACGSDPGRKKTPFGKVILRRTILESRHYLLRGNGYYWAYRGLRSRPVRALFAKPKVTLAALRPEI